MSYLVFKINPVISVLFTFVTYDLSYAKFLTTLLLTTLLSLLKSTGTVFNLTISILSASTFNLAKFDFNARLDVSVPVAFFKSVFVI